jgi:predicted NBD/HSP70 family sugar kinase
MTQYILGFDIGGTKTYAALANGNGEMLAEEQAPTIRWNGQADYGEQFVHLRDTLLLRSGMPDARIAAVGVAVAGIMNPATNMVVMCPNISDTAFDLQALIESALGVPAHVENDVNLAAVGEHWRGAARNCPHFVFLAIGTGIGAGVFINGQLYRGAHNAAGETGHLYVHGLERIGPDGLGVLERRASGTGIVRQAQKRLAESAAQSTLAGRELTTSDVLQAAAQGDPLAAGVLDDTLTTLALGLANIAFVLDPEMIVLGGGVGNAGDSLLVPLRERLAALLVHPVAPRLELSQLGAQAQLYGAVRYALDMRV